MIVGFILVIALLVLLFFVYQRGGLDFLRGGENPGEILDRRYAAGEITEEEYKRMKNTLNT
ncbi:MAG: SHOCT domain-containing protein [Deltaproteobacteria bacterium]|uniref:SHOCT domain-containing protein n=1 Tax=Candidatus Zymogenus saltonus TaxID=2844893 RepID=A0A9D8PRA5_9DELT|nr:SHOCT domain-containing protein [Candidatus Zymogenus saltonus]